MKDRTELETDPSRIPAKEIARQKRARDYKKFKEHQKQARDEAKAEKEQQRAEAKEARLAELRKLIRKGSAC
ncbi:MAG: hypothetical protein AB7T49_15940 [Oligoflexales bacterium]